MSCILLKLESHFGLIEPVYAGHFFPEANHCHLYLDCWYSLVCLHHPLMESRWDWTVSSVLKKLPRLSNLLARYSSFSNWAYLWRLTMSTCYRTFIRMWCNACGAVRALPGLLLQFTCLHSWSIPSTLWDFLQSPHNSQLCNHLVTLDLRVCVFVCDRKNWFIPFFDFMVFLESCCHLAQPEIKSTF